MPTTIPTRMIIATHIPAIAPELIEFLSSFCFISSLKEKFKVFPVIGEQKLHFAMQIKLHVLQSFCTLDFQKQNYSSYIGNNVHAYHSNNQSN